MTTEYRCCGGCGFEMAAEATRIEMAREMACDVLLSTDNKSRPNGVVAAAGYENKSGKNTVSLVPLRDVASA